MYRHRPGFTHSHGTQVAGSNTASLKVSFSLFHQDADAYKLVVKDEISSWQQMLREHNVQDWMIILVETKNPTRGQKPKLALPRSSVADKIKNDFCSRQSDR